MNLKCVLFVLTAFVSTLLVSGSPFVGSDVPSSEPPAATASEDANAPPPGTRATQACCWSDCSGFCTDESTSFCDLIGGTPQGPGTTCQDDPCPVIGACCPADDSCSYIEVGSCNDTPGAIFAAPCVGCGGDCNSTGRPDTCDIARGFSDDCQGDWIPDECQLVPDCNVNEIPDECEPDCNYNNIPDDCDIAAGTSMDCQPDDVPDECQLARPFRFDSYPMSPINRDVSQSLGFFPPIACSDVTLSFEVYADLGPYDEYLEIFMNTAAVGTIGYEDMSSCPLPAFETQLTVSQQRFNQDVQSIGFVVFEAQASNKVGEFCHPRSYIRMGVEYLSDCNENNIPNECDIMWGTSDDCNANDIPDECEMDCNFNGVQDECELAGNDCNNNGMPDDCEPQNDCNGNSMLDICEIGVTAADCNGNHVLDSCDIAALASEDCNANGVPDECESRTDCDTNGVKDICELAAGTATDCNTNGIPDACDVWLRDSEDRNFNFLPDICESGIESHGDFDRDGDVDTDDHGVFVGCVSGPGAPASAGCHWCDMDADLDVDLFDFGEFAKLIAEPETGACCLSNGSCVDDLPWPGCVANNGVFLGVDSDCLSGGPCRSMPQVLQIESLYDHTSGVFGLPIPLWRPGDGGMRDIDGMGPSSYVQACCYPDEFCDDLDPFLCQFDNGQPQGSGTSCATTTCGFYPVDYIEPRSPGIKWIEVSFDRALDEQSCEVSSDVSIVGSLTGPQNVGISSVWGPQPSDLTIFLDPAPQDGECHLFTLTGQLSAAHSYVPADQRSFRIVALVGDVNGDFVVNSVDGNWITNPLYWQTITTAESSRMDLDGNGMIQALDLAIVTGPSHWMVTASDCE